MPLFELCRPKVLPKEGRFKRLFLIRITYYPFDDSPIKSVNLLDTLCINTLQL